MAIFRHGTRPVHNSRKRTHAPTLLLDLRGEEQQHAGASPGSPAWLAVERVDHAFLCSHLIDDATLDRAIALAAESGATTAETLIALGWVEERAYVEALADRLGLPVAPPGSVISLPDDQTPGRLPYAVAMAPPDRLTGGLDGIGVRAAAVPPRLLVRHLSAEPRTWSRTWLLTSHDIAEARVAFDRQPMLRRAVRELALTKPDFSARTGAATWQHLMGAMVLGVALGALAVAPDAAAALLGFGLTLPFLCVSLLRLVALAALLMPARGSAPDAERLSSFDLPFYTVMVPLFREVEVLPRLVAALGALDYPATRLEVLLILEERDLPTREAAARMALPGNFRVVVVPAGGPQTKPKALNYALQLARGEIVVVYDAEDRPEPGQLRAAVEVLRGGDPTIGCVQARLNIYNPSASLVTRQFTIEYSALFDAMLPALDRLGIPMPLGGTSNHFPIEVLRALGAWDPYNVTEDADLGIRLARRGLRTVTIPSTTWEEAPADLGNWFRQRTRWLKGWMQTAIVHTRQPGQLRRDLGAWRCLGLHVLMTGMLLSVLVHPLFWALVVWEAAHGRLLATPDAGSEMWLWWIAGINLALGFSASILVGGIATWQRGRRSLTLWALAMPLYWLLISAAGYRAMWELVRRPFHWGKTRHGGSRP